MQPWQHTVHAVGVRSNGRTSAGVTQFAAAPDLVGHLVAGQIARRNVRLDGAVQHDLAGLDVGPADRTEDGHALFVAWLFASEGGNGVGD